MGFIVFHNPSCLPLLPQTLPLLQDTVLHKILLHASFPGATVLQTVLQCGSLHGMHFFCKRLFHVGPSLLLTGVYYRDVHTVLLLAGHIHLLWNGLIHSVAQISAPWHGLLHKLQGNLCLEHLLSSFFIDLGVCRVFSIKY